MNFRGQNGNAPFGEEDEKKNVENMKTRGNSKPMPKLNYSGGSDQSSYRSTTSMSYRSMNAPVLSETRTFGPPPKLIFHSTGDPKAELFPMSGFAKTPTVAKEVDMIDVRNQDMRECGMRQCEVFVPCAVLEPLDVDMKLVVNGLDEDRKIGGEDSNEFVGLKINDTHCVVSNEIQECMTLVPLGLARVSDDIDLKLLTTVESLQNDNDRSKYSNRQIPFIEGCVMITHKPIVFAVHFYECPNDKSSTLIEFQRRNGDTFVFQTFYEESIKQLKKTMTNLRNDQSNPVVEGWNGLPRLDDMIMDELQSEPCTAWNSDCLDLLSSLIDDESQEAVDMLGSLCAEMEKYPSLRTQVCQHKSLMKQIMSRVLTHQDQCFVRLGLVALDTIFREQKADFVKHVLRSQPILAFVISLLDCASVFVLRRAVRLLSLLANQCKCSWTLNDTQKQLLHECVPRVQRRLLGTDSWSSVYATEAFITKDMFQFIVQHPKF